MTTTISPEKRHSTRTKLKGIHPAAFEHPIDRAALEVLRKTPGLPFLLKKLASLGFERQVRIYFTADTLRLSPKQCPEIYNLLVEAAEILDMPEPELYLWQNPFPNAFAIGMDRHTIVVTSGLVELLDEDELQAVIAHELGHIKSGHSLYRTIAIYLAIAGLHVARNLPFVNLLSDMILYALYDWSRKSELTADRAGLLVVQDPAVSVRTLLKLAGGGNSTIGEASTAEFLRQADDYEDMDASPLNVLYKFELTRFQTHPFPALRAREINQWGASKEYQEIISGNYRMESENNTLRFCTSCGSRIENLAFRFCPDCGDALK